MLKKLFCLIALSMLLSTGLQAQRWSFAGGFVYEFITLKVKEPFIGDPRSATLGPFYGLSLNGQYAIVHKNDVVSLSVDPGIRLGFNYFTYNNISGGWILAQAPVTIMGRVGAGATAFNEQKIGLGLGFGGNFTYFQVTQSNPLRKAFVTPNAVIELNINGRGSGYQLRFHFSPWGMPLDHLSETTHFTNIGIELLSTF